jgi:hypothetical protein
MTFTGGGRAALVRIPGFNGREKIDRLAAHRAIREEKVKSSNTEDTEKRGEKQRMRSARPDTEIAARPIQMDHLALSGFLYVFLCVKGFAPRQKTFNTEDTEK